MFYQCAKSNPNNSWSLILNKVLLPIYLLKTLLAAINSIDKFDSKKIQELIFA